MMVVSRRDVLPRQAGHEKTMSFEAILAGAGTLAVDTRPRKDEDSAIAVSIMSNRRLVSEGLFALLSTQLNLKLVGAYSYESDLRSAPPSPQGHVVLLDSTAGHDVVTAWTRYWRRQIPPANVVILELAKDNAAIFACIEAGASGFTLQDASAAEVAKAIEDAYQGVAFCPPDMTARLYARLASLADSVRQLSTSPLTPREVEILRFVAMGYTNQEIAAKLVIKLRTVKQHVHNILGKLNTGNRHDAVRLALDVGWLREDPAIRLESN